MPMPVLELLALRLRPSISPTDPTLVPNLSTVRSLIRTNSRFYHCIEDPRLIYILGQWPSLDAHRAFLASPGKDGILAHQTHQLDFGWMLHLDLPSPSSSSGHGEVCMEDVVPFKAPVLSIARFFFSHSHSSAPHDDAIDAYKAVLAKHRSAVVEAMQPHPVFEAWRVDAPEGKAEHVLLTGWESLEAHAEFTRAMREVSPGYAGVRDCVEGLEVRHMRDMEA